MWMVESDDHVKELKIPADPIYGRKLRPLMPRPMSSCTTKSSPFCATLSPCYCCFHNPNILPWNQPMNGVGDYGVKREITAAPLVSTRWNPTPEQLQALEEMYRRGTRTPSAEQIQQIAAKLRRFGKIEGKNVFYWFQNHKARERQKKRRQLELLAAKKMHHFEALETKQTGRSRKYVEIEEQHKKLPVPLNCCTPSEDSAASMHGAVMAECKRDEWTQLQQKELQQKIVTAKNEICWQLDLSSCLSPNKSTHTITSEQENTGPFGGLNLSIVLPNRNDDDNIESGAKENRTLELFPVRKNDLRTIEGEMHKFTPSEFIEFLPTKN